MSQLEEIKARAQVNLYIGKTASQDEAKDTLKLIAAWEAVEAYMVEQEGRTAFPDADAIDRAYSLGRRHSYDAVRAVFREALA